MSNIQFKIENNQNKNLNQWLGQAKLSLNPSSLFTGLTDETIKSLHFEEKIYELPENFTIHLAEIQVIPDPVINRARILANQNLADELLEIGEMENQSAEKLQEMLNQPHQLFNLIINGGRYKIATTDDEQKEVVQTYRENYQLILETTDTQVVPELTKPVTTDMNNLPDLETITNQQNISQEKPAVAPFFTEEKEVSEPNKPLPSNPINDLPITTKKVAQKKAFYAQKWFMPFIVVLILVAVTFVSLSMLNSNKKADATTEQNKKIAQQTDQTKASEKENRALKAVQSKYERTAEISYHPDTKSFVYNSTDPVMKSALALALSGEIEQDDWQNIVSQITTLSEAIKSDLGPGYSVTVANPENIQEMLLIVKDGKVTDSVVE